MTTIQITLPDQLVLEAQNAGLLNASCLEQWLREQLRKQHIDELFSAMDSMNVIDEPDAISPEEMAEEIAKTTSFVVAFAGIEATTGALPLTLKATLKGVAFAILAGFFRKAELSVGSY